LKLLSKGNIEKLQEIYYAMESAGVVNGDNQKDVGDFNSNAPKNELF
jgi:hypothetical protein